MKTKIDKEKIKKLKKEREEKIQEQTLVKKDEPLKSECYGI